MFRKIDKKSRNYIIYYYFVNLLYFLVEIQRSKLYFLFESSTLKGEVFEKIGFLRNITCLLEYLILGISIIYLISMGLKNKELLIQYLTISIFTLISILVLSIILKKITGFPYLLQSSLLVYPLIIGVTIYYALKQLYKWIR